VAISDGAGMMNFGMRSTRDASSQTMTAPATVAAGTTYLDRF